MIRALYDWVMALAVSPRARPTLFAVALAESSFFPIPPDLLLMPMTLATPRRGWYLAGLCTMGSVIGGAIGYGIGYQFWRWIGEPLVHFYGGTSHYQDLAALFHTHDAWIVGIAAFSPIPYKLFTLTAGAVRSDLPVFLMVSTLARGARFYLITGLLIWGGDPLRIWIERYLNKITLVIAVILILFLTIWL